MLVDDLHESLVVKDVTSHGDEHAHKHAKECKTTNAGGPATTLLEDNRERSEGQVQRTVDDGHVNRGEENNGLLEQEDPGTEQGKRDPVLDGQLGLANVKLADVLLACTLGELLGANAKEPRGIGLGAEEHAGKPKDAHEDSHHAFEPTETRGVTKEAASNGT